ncbi:ATP-binding cassette domain-containing protein [Cohnella sp. CFH 77786]|uniref:ABC transporter ATP-binding protein n=1 Tax=Cohnella sp. CFH 77786 TaxID=2662265 RepID=UPI001C60E93C|nr:ABC transporter ATP-binding protein [Cohnella sp. CFH 77786]MBW5446100.1 ATP-binding cassette domain-containing protein [Cohnella sp. CFH 77786]
MNGKLQEPILSVSGLTVDVAADSGTIRILDDISLQVRSGSVLGIVGESGSGKSMTCLACMGLLPPGAAAVKGSIALAGRELLSLSPADRRRLRGSRLSIVMQNPMASFNPIRTIGNHFAETIRAHTAIRRKDAWEQAVLHLERIGLPRPAELMKMRPYQLSGGMLQRVMIAIALSSGPDVLFADEPTTALDLASQRHVLGELEQLCRSEGTALVIVTHDLGVIAELADEVAVIHRGRIVESAGVYQLFDRPQHPYTKLLLETRIG